MVFFFFFQAEDGIRDLTVTGVQTCALPIWTCAITLIAFALGGSIIFKIFGITIGAFKIAGGVLIGLNALDMVQARRSQQRETPVEKAEGIQKEDIGILPLGVPMLAGPGAISTGMVLALGAKSGGAPAAV